MKKILMTVLTAGLAFAMIGNTGTAYAEESAETSHKGYSEASVKFQAPDEFETIAPLDPTNPDNPDYTPEPGGGNIPDLPENKSGLSIDYVSNIKFGDDNTLSLDKQRINSSTKYPYIQVTDQRYTEAGWNLTAQASSFVLVGTEKSTLNGAKIYFKNGDTTAKKELLDNITEPKVNPEIELLTNGDSNTVASALSKKERQNEDNPQGLGTWLIRWLAGEEYENTGNEKVILEVPVASATSGEHSSIITWTLTDGPAINHK